MLCSRASLPYSASVTAQGPREIGQGKRVYVGKLANPTSRAFFLLEAICAPFMHTPLIRGPP